MNTPGTWFRETLGWSGALLLTAVALPVLAIATWVLRALIVPVVVLLLATAAVLYCASARFRCWAAGATPADVADHPMTT